MNTFMNEPYVPPEVIAEENYIREGIEKYGREGFWKLIEELTKDGFKPYKLPMIRRSWSFVGQGELA